jgi:peptidyl-prolyl cis-trans isomerase D
MSQNIADDMKRAMGKKQFSMKKVTAVLLFSAIALVFVFSGVSRRTNDLGAGTVAQINDSLISAVELGREQQRIEQYYAQMFGGMDLGTQRQFINQEALQNLVNSELVSQATKKEGLGAADGEVLDFIVKDYTVFQVNGVFQRDRYFQFLEMNHFTPADFENLLRKEIENVRARHAFEWASLDNNLEKEKETQLKQTQVILSYIIFNPQDLEKNMKFSDSEISQALAKPEFANRAENEFKARKSQFDQKEQVKAQHILIKAEMGNSKAESAALEKAKSLRAQALKGDFGSLAEKNSDDPGSKSKKGDLGYFSRGQMVPEFDAAAFKMKIGEISEPIKTQFGYHIIKVLDKKPAINASFASNKNDVAQILLARDQVTSQKTKLAEIFNNGEGKNWLSKMNLTWKDTSAFDLGADSIPGLNSAKVADALADVITESSKIHVIQDGDTQYIIKVKDIKSILSPVSKSETKTAANEATQKLKAQDLFEGWVQNFRDSSKVEINPAVLANP